VTDPDQIDVSRIAPAYAALRRAAFASHCYPAAAQKKSCAANVNQDVSHSCCRCWVLCGGY
jgi:hypothetical protein